MDNKTVKLSNYDLVSKRRVFCRAVLDIETLHVQVKMKLIIIPISRHVTKNKVLQFENSICKEQMRIQLWSSR